MKKQIAILSKYNSMGASSRYRCYNYEKYFNSHNINVTYFPLLTGNYIENLYQKNRFKIFLYQFTGIIKRIFQLLFLMRKFDFLIIEKELIPNCPYILEKLLLHRKVFSLDFDDYIGTTYKTGPIKRIFLKNKIDNLAKTAKFVTVGNNWYFTEIRSNNLVYLPTVIDLDKYTFTKKHHNNHMIVLVWIGSPTTVKYLENLKIALQNLSQRRQFKLKIIGGKFSLPGVDIQEIVWNSESEIEEILTGDIGLMPLNDTLWEKGKCGFKLIQYMACGLPVVASPAPANEEIIEIDKTGYIASDTSQWECYLDKLMTEHELRSDFGHKGRQRVENLYCYQFWGDKFAELVYENC
jgi:glycosyltransferase involved in cell wall biosynthesis